MTSDWDLFDSDEELAVDTDVDLQISKENERKKKQAINQQVAAHRDETANLHWFFKK
eukprot:Pgem_evm1s1096